MKFLLDTNVATAVGARDADYQGIRDFLQCSGGGLALAPPVIIELLIKVLNGSDGYFNKNKRALDRLIAFGAKILELPQSFAKLLFFGPNIFIAGLRADHYPPLLIALSCSHSKSEFIARANQPTVGWKPIEQLPQIHNAEVRQNLLDLRGLASQRSQKTFGEKVAESLGVGPNKPDPDKVSQAFSAAFEYLQANILRVQGGAKPWRNDRGLWIDYNILWYLADPDITVISSEKFHKAIRKSPQLSRILLPPWANNRP